MRRYSCPACSKSLHIARHEGARFWRCPACKGFLVALAPIRKRIPTETFNALWQTARNGGVKGWRNCAGCNQHMRLIEVGSKEEPTELDVCEPCQLIWFDPEELESLEQVQDEEQEQEPDNDEKASMALRRYNAITEARTMDVNVGLSRGDSGAAQLVSWSKTVPETPPRWSGRLAALLLCFLVLLVSSLPEAFQALSYRGPHAGPLAWLASAFAGPHMGAAFMVSAIVLVSGPIVERVAGWVRTMVVFLASHGAGLVAMAVFVDEPVLSFYGAMGGATGLACAAWWGWGEAAEFYGKSNEESSPLGTGFMIRNRMSKVPKRPYRRVVYVRGRAVRIDPSVNPAIIRLIFAPSLVFTLTQWNMKSFVFAMEPFQMAGYAAYLSAVAGTGWLMGLMWVARQRK